MLRLIPYARSNSDCRNLENLYTVWRTVRHELCSSIKAYKKDVEVFHLQPIYMNSAFVNSSHYVTITMYDHSVL